MPHRARNHYQSHRSPEELRAQGPTLEVEVMLTQESAKLRKEQPRHKTTALIDTGADGCCIDASVAKALGLVSLGKVPAVGAFGKYMANKYLVDFDFVGSDIHVRNVPVLEASLHRRGYRMLIGRDVLSVALFSYDGSAGKLDLMIPSPSMLTEAQAEKPIEAGSESDPAKKRKKKKGGKRKMQKRSRRRNR